MQKINIGRPDPDQPIEWREGNRQNKTHNEKE